ncbi:MAG TPA: alpha/beta fold hydrolase [Thermoleophilaceae bacterium]
MTRRRALFLAAALLGAVLLAIDARMWDEGGPGIVGFELAWDTRSAERILGEWGPDGRDAARLSLWLDFAFLASYAAFWALASRALRLRVWPLALAAGAFDALENVCLLVVLGGSTSGWPLLASSFATLKVLALAVVVGSVAVALVRRAHARRRRAVRAFAAGAALLVVAALAVNTWLVDRATAPAEPGIGQLVEVPAGTIHVSDEGSGPPVVLIHGFGCSLNWWTPVMPLLRKSLRVIRLDLLGHGRSEKPRDGYSMEEQADVVADVMRRLGVHRAAVVGHSMGGMVATALAERHRAMVSRLMLIGTAPDDADEHLGLTARLPFVPVVGHAIDTLVPERLVRLAVEDGFAPGFDPPAEFSRDIFDHTTYRSLTQSARAVSDFWDDGPLHERLRGTHVPLTVLLGEEERHTRRSTGLYNSVPGARTVVMQGLDHTPQVESPARTGPLIAAFAAGR